MSVPIIVSVGEDSLKAVPDSTAKRRFVGRQPLGNRLSRLVSRREERPVGRRVAGRRPRDRRDDGRVDVQRPCRADSAQSVGPLRTLTATIASELGEAVNGGPHFRVLFVIGLVLFVISMAVNLTADLVVKGIHGERD